MSTSDAKSYSEIQGTILTSNERMAAISHLTDRDTFAARDIAIERAVLTKLRASATDTLKCFAVAPQTPIAYISEYALRQLQDIHVSSYSAALKKVPGPGYVAIAVIPEHRDG